MTDVKTPDEMSNQAVAKKVISPKRRYFFPAHSLSVVADNEVEAQKLLDKQLKQTEESK